MTTRDEDLTWFRELLAPIGRITVRRMFGGAGFYADGRIMALEVDGGLYLKVDAQTRPRFEAAGCRPFVYMGGGKPVAMSYWSAPDEAMDDPDAMTPWARLAMDAATRAAAAKPAAKKTGAKRTAVEKVAVKKTVLKKSVLKKTALKKSAMKKAVTKKAVTKKAVTKKAVTKKATARNATAGKTARQRNT